MKRKLRKVFLVTGGLFFLLTNGFSQQREFNDPQIISVVETIHKIILDYGGIAQHRSRNDEIKEFTRSMINDYTILFQQTLDLKKELILSTQTNEITRNLLKQREANIQLLNSGEQECFDITYLEDIYNFQEASVEILNNILIPQARNEKLKNFLLNISSKWRVNLMNIKKLK